MVIWLATFNYLHSALLFFFFLLSLTPSDRSSWEPLLSRMDILSSQWLGSGYNEKQINTIHWVCMHISTYLIDGRGKKLNEICQMNLASQF